MFVHRLICARTFEEKIHREAVRKERLVRLLFPPRRVRGDQTRDGSGGQVAENALGARVDTFLRRSMEQGNGEEKALVAGYTDYEVYF